MYHLLATAYLLQRVKRVKEETVICFENVPAGEELFRFLSVDIAEYNPAAEPEPLPSTANIIQEHFVTGCLESLATTIRKAAQDKGWSSPYQELETPAPTLVIWQREEGYRHFRNSSKLLLDQLVGLCRRHATTPVLLGTPHGLPGAIEFGNFYEAPFFKSEDSIPKQLWFFDTLFGLYGAIAQVGMMRVPWTDQLCVLGIRRSFWPGMEMPLLGCKRCRGQHRVSSGSVLSIRVTSRS